MRLLCLITACLLATSAHAEVQVRRGQGVPPPTQPVTTNNLEAPVFQSDTRNLEAILDKEETARVTRDAQPMAKPKPAAAPAAAMPTPLVTVPATPTPAEPIPTAEEQGFLSSTLMSMRVFAIRWRDTIDIFFLIILVIYVRKLYVLSREQHKILSHSIRSAEYSAAAAKRSAEVCEMLLKHQEKPDEAQGQLDL